MNTKRCVLFIAVIALAGLLCVSHPGSGAAQAAESAGHLQVFGAFATPLEEPWNSVIHAALLDAQEQGHITYTWKDRLGYRGAMTETLREVAEQRRPHLIVGDAYGNEEAVRQVSKDYPTTAFVLGSGLKPLTPNVSVFTNWLHEPAYLCGLIAGTLTKSHHIGVVGGYPVREVNGLVNAFMAGVKEANAQAHVSVRFIQAWFDPAAAQQAALALIDAGADLLFAERAGVIEAAKARGKLAFGNIADQNDLAPDTVISSAVWDMKPTVQYVIKQLQTGSYVAQDLRDFSMMAKGGARLAPLRGQADQLPKELLDRVRARERAIRQGVFHVPLVETAPPSD